MAQLPSLNSAVLDQTGQLTSAWVGFLTQLVGTDKRVNILQDNYGVLEQDVTDIQSTTTTLQANYNTLSSTVSDNYTALTTSDTALAGEIETVSATATAAGTAAGAAQTAADQISASGQISFIATAAPTGATAAYSLVLTAGNVETGLMLIAKSDGTSAIVLNAASTTIQAPGVNGGDPTTLFTINSGKAVFDVAVQVNGGNIAESSVTNFQTYYASSTTTLASGATTQNGVISASQLNFTTDVDSLLEVTANLLLHANGAFSNPCTLNIFLNVDGTTIAQLPCPGTTSSVGTQQAFLNETYALEIGPGTHFAVLTWTYAGTSVTSASIDLGSRCAIKVTKR